MDHRNRFFRGITPLVGNRDLMRAARIYPGGGHLDRIFGSKPDPEPGWFYPEAWLFSPAPAINLGSLRGDEGLTRIYDREGKSHSWGEYAELIGPDLLGPYSLRLSVKLLDGSVTLPKEFHFRESDSELLRNYAKIKSFTGSLIKPEVWIRHPFAEDEPGPSYFGFSRKLSSAALHEKIAEGPESLERVMNSVTIERGSSLYLPGGIVHSLGPGLYFEVLSDGDLKVTLQDEFAGRKLTTEDRLDKLATGCSDDLRRALEFIDYETWGDSVVEACSNTPVALDAHRKQIVHTTHFEAEWIEIPPGDRYTIDNSNQPRPRIIIAANGSCLAESSSESFQLASDAGSYEEFVRSRSCYGAIVHYSARHIDFTNQSSRVFTALHACEPSRS